MICECPSQAHIDCKGCKPCMDKRTVLAKCYGCEDVLDSGDSFWGNSDVGIYCPNCADDRIAELWQRRM